MDQRFGLLQSPMPQSYVIFMRKSASTGLRQQKRPNMSYTVVFYFSHRESEKSPRTFRYLKMEKFPEQVPAILCFFFKSEAFGDPKSTIPKMLHPTGRAALRDLYPGRTPTGSDRSVDVIQILGGGNLEFTHAFGCQACECFFFVCVLSRLRVGRVFGIFMGNPT